MFVRSALRYLNCREDTLVLDPWGGSGTTGTVASKVNVPSVCVDINPVMAIFAAAKSTLVLSRRDQLMDFFESVDITDETQGSSQGEENPLNDMFTAETVALIQSLVNNIPFVPHFYRSGAGTVQKVNTALKDAEQAIDSVYAFSLAVIFVAVRKLSGIRRSSNPTWLKSRKDKVYIDPRVLFDELRRCAYNMLMDVNLFFEGGVGAPNPVLHADVKSLPLRDGSVDVVITSPPYLTRIDYAMATMPEMHLLGNASLLTYTRHRTMGAPVITTEVKHQKPEWGPTCNRILDAVKNHPTKAAKTYYWKNIVQYFMDLDAALNEVQRVLTADGKALVVVQSSYFKDIEIPLGDIYCEMAENKELKAEVVYCEEVHGHMAHVNTKSSQYKKNKSYREETIYIRK